jgi:hypothetical protein
MKHYLTLLLLVTFQYNTYAQCSYTPPIGECIVGCTSTLTNGSNVNGGQVFCYTGSGSLSNINLSGGIIRVCGDLTISNLNPNSGIIIIAPTGTLTIVGDKSFNGNVQLVNRGTVNFQGNLTLQNSNNYIYNDGTYNQTGQLRLSSATSYFINKLNHTANINDLLMNSGFLCLEDNSIVNVNFFTNNQVNTASFSSISGNACFHILQNAQLNASSFTFNPEIGACIDASATTDGSGTWGNASVFTNCSSCSIALPIELLSFNVSLENNIVKTFWTTVSEINSDYYTLEKSRDAINWVKFSEQTGAGNSNSILNYSDIDNNPFQGISYYRLKQTDFDGQFEYSKVRSVNIKSKGDSRIKIFPNPTESQITIAGNKYELDYVKIYNTLGQDVTRFTYQINSDKSKLTIDLSELSEGMYYVKTKTTTNKVYKQ